MGKDKEIMQEAIKTFGYSNQVAKFVEEAGECIASVMRFQTKPNMVNQDKMCEELADLGIMIEQMKIMFAKGNIQEHWDKKIVRLEKRLKCINYEKYDSKKEI